MKTRSIQAALRSANAAARSADFVASSPAVDRYGEIVEQSWSLDAYKRNPVVLYAHDSSALPIGKATRVAVVGGQLECTIQFATEAMNPKAEQVWQMLQVGMLNAVSVGFMPQDVKQAKADGKDVTVLGNNELLEISVVPVPANPEALAKSAAATRARTWAAMTFAEKHALVRANPAEARRLRAHAVIHNARLELMARGHGEGAIRSLLGAFPDPALVADAIELVLVQSLSPTGAIALVRANARRT